MVQRRRRSEQEVETQVLERGHLYFFYRPKVNRRVVKGLQDVQRLYLIMHPHRRRRYRLLIVGEKHLPSVTGAGDRKTWTFVAKVARRAQEVEDELDPVTYHTKTRGERVLPGARPVGEGVYAIVHHGDHTHLAYELELPTQPGLVQQSLNIVPEASYIINVKNPEAPAPSGLGLDESRQANYPPKLRELFGGRRFIDLDPPDFLDYEGCELLLIGASADLEAELGLELDPEYENLATSGIFEDLKLEKSLHPVAPLLEGKWE